MTDVGRNSCFLCLRVSQIKQTLPSATCRRQFFHDKMPVCPGNLARHALQLASKYGLHVDPNKCTLYLLAGEAFRGDVPRFQALGVRVVTGTDITMLKVPTGKGPQHLQGFHQQKLSEFWDLCKLLTTLPHTHVESWLLRNGRKFSKVQWWCRTTPRRLLGTCCPTSTQSKDKPWKRYLELRSPHTNGPKPSYRRGLGLAVPRTHPCSPTLHSVTQLLCSWGVRIFLRVRFVSKT